MARERDRPDTDLDLDKSVESVVDLDQIVERLRWTPKQRMDYLVDMLDFEERAHRARRVS